MDKRTEKERLAQGQNLETFLRQYQPNEFITVYFDETANSYNRGIYSALIPNEYVELALSRLTWDLMHEGGMPSTTRYGDGHIEYHRFGDDSGVEPLVIGREFYGMRDNYIELSEEFRFFHNLYHDIKANKYIKIDDSGNETVISIVENNRVQIRLKEILQYTAVKDMHFSIQFDFREDSILTLEELGFEDGESVEHRQTLATWGLGYGDFGGGKHRSFSRLFGKRLFTPFPKEKSGIWGYSDEPEENFMEFIIDVNEYGEEVKHTANPAALDSPEGVPFLTPVHFKKQVLDKYYKEPSKYTVSSGHLSCGYLWGLFIDNHHEDRVCVWLGDLGESLSYSEQQYWAAFNIQPKGTVSEVYFQRQLMAIPTNSDQPEHIFSEKYLKLHESCTDCLNWQLLLPLANDDQYLIKEIRIPATNEQADFDKLIQALTKILIDSLNEKKLNEYIPDERRANIKGSISRLEVALTAICAPTHDSHVAFLRNLQDLRSSSVAHRKGKNYAKVASGFGIESKNLTTIATEILNRAIDVLAYMISLIENGKFEIAKTSGE